MSLLNELFVAPRRIINDPGALTYLWLLTVPFCTPASAAYSFMTGDSELKRASGPNVSS